MAARPASPFLMSTKTEIVNSALARLGQRPINNVETATSDRADTIRTLWDGVVDEIQSLYNWQACVKLVMLAKRAEETPFGESVFNLPNGFYRVLEVFPSVDWRVENGLFIAATDSIRALVLARNDNTQQWGPHLTKAITSKLASMLAMSVLQNPQLAQAQVQLSEKDVRDAGLENNLQSKRIRKAKSSSWLYE